MYSKLRNEIIALSKLGCELNPKIQAASGRERHALRFEKKAIGARTRELLLILGFLQGRPYITIEKSCIAGLRPGPATLFRKIESLVKAETLGADAEANRESIKEWFSGPSIELQQVAE